MLLFLDAAAGAEVLPARTIETESVIAPVNGSLGLAGDSLAQGDVRVEESGVEHPVAVAGTEGAQVVLISGDRRALRDAAESGALDGPLGSFVAATLAELTSDLVAS